MRAGERSRENARETFALTDVGNAAKSLPRRRYPVREPFGPASGDLMRRRSGELAMPTPMPEAGEIRNVVDGSSARGAWQPVVWLGAVVLVCWVVPAWRGHGLYGHGLFEVIHAYTGIFAVLAWLASLTVAL